jgi:hypothetical protein
MGSHGVMYLKLHLSSNKDFISSYKESIIVNVLRVPVRSGEDTDNPSTIAQSPGDQGLDGGLLVPKPPEIPAELVEATLQVSLS